MRPDIFDQLYKSIISSQKPNVSFTTAGSLSQEEALAIYRNGYKARLTDSLTEKYESIARFLGDCQFQNLCKDFIAQQNSFDGNINNYGDHLAGFLERHEVSNEWPFLVDLARMDLLRFRLFHQPPHQGLEAASLITQISSYAETDFKLQLLPTVQIMESLFPLYEMWQAIYQNKNFPEPQPENIQTLVFWKRGSQVYFKPVSGNIGMSLQKIRWDFPVLASMRLLQDSEISEIFQFLGEEGLVSQVKNLGN